MLMNEFSADLLTLVLIAGYSSQLIQEMIGIVCSSGYRQGPSDNHFLNTQRTETITATSELLLWITIVANALQLY